MSNSLNLSVTLWPSFPHFERFARDNRIASIRLNSAMMSNPELEVELAQIKAMDVRTPLYFDVKGRQLRITEVIPNKEYLDIRLNHPIKVKTPTPVLFKAGADIALLEEVLENGYRLKFNGGPKFNVKDGESIHIRHESLQVGGNQFTLLELEKIEKVKKAGFKNYFLSYVQNQADVDEFISIVGNDCKVNLKIEDKKGMDYVRTSFIKRANLTLVAARGDLYVELDRPHEILGAVKTIIEKDPDAIVGSRLLLSTITNSVPSCADWSELAWLYDVGYRNMMLCDELCLKEPLLSRAVNAFDAFKRSYERKPSIVVKKGSWWLGPRLLRGQSMK